MREFHPPVRASRARTVLAILLGAIVVACLVPVALVACGSQRVTYTRVGATLYVDSRSWIDGRREISLSALHDARAVTLGRGRRTLGTAMPGYCAGRFSYPDLGTVWQATDCSAQAVLLTTSDGEPPVVVTPPDRDAFIEALRTGTDFRIELPPPPASGTRALLLLIIPLGLLTALGVVAVAVLGPGRMVYRVGGGQLEVRTLFGRRAWPTSGLRARGHSARLQMRVAGTGLPGYYTGYYLADGQRTRVYATQREGGVLLEGPARIYLSPADREGFLAALRGEGATVEPA